MRAVFIARFQPFHNGHLYALRKIAKDYNEIFIVIGSANKSFTKHNPFTLAERIKMVKLIADREGIPARIIPINDVEDDGLWLRSILKKIKHIDAVFSNNPWVKRIFESAGYVVRDTGSYHRQVYEGTHIRKLMAEGKEWERGVPKEIAHYIRKIKGEDRVKKLFLN